MQFGMVGLGRMDANMALRLMRGGHSCVAYDRDPDRVEHVAAQVRDGSRFCNSGRIERSLSVITLFANRDIYHFGCERRCHVICE